MSDRATFSPSTLSEEEYREKLTSDDIMDKFQAISYEIHQMKPESWSYLRLISYLEWFFDKVIEKKVPDKVAQNRLMKFNLVNKIELMKKWELLIDDNLSDVNLIKDIRNDIAHSLIYDQEKIDGKLRDELKNYNKEEFKELHPFDRCIGTILDIMGLITTAIHTHFEYKPTQKSIKAN